MTTLSRRLPATATRCAMKTNGKMNMSQDLCVLVRETLDSVPDAGITELTRYASRAMVIGHARTTSRFREGIAGRGDL